MSLWKRPQLEKDTHMQIIYKELETNRYVHVITLGKENLRQLTNLGSFEHHFDTITPSHWSFVPEQFEIEDGVYRATLIPVELLENVAA
jgi:hypothetical protein